MSALRRVAPLCFLLLIDKPCPDGFEDVLFLGRVQRTALWYPVPLPQTAATAGGRRVLGYKNRVLAHGRLLSIIGGQGRGQTLLYEISRMFHHHC